MSKPNILIFMTDQQRGATALPEHPAKTPNLEVFGKQGVTFTQTFCPSPHCCPSRATFMSGLYPTEHGVWHNVAVLNAISRGLNEGVRLWSEDLNEAGYDLEYIGKWHVSALESPADRGWKEGHVTSRKGMATPENVWGAYRQKAELPEQARSDGQIVRNGYGDLQFYGIKENPCNDEEVRLGAIEALSRKNAESDPWCMYVGPLGPHDPYHVPQRFLDMYNLDDIQLPESYSDKMEDKPALYRRTRDNFDQLTELEQRKTIMHYYAFCSYEDWLFGEVLKALEKTGQADNTIVVYCSDHGDYLGEHGLWCKGLPCFRGAYEVPNIIRWPAGLKNPGRRVEEFVSLADFAPTFLEVAGVKTGRRFAGASLMPFIYNEKPESWRDAIFTQSMGNELFGIQRSIMTKDWKFVYNGFDYDELYDLKADPDEVKNLATDPQYKELMKDMMTRIWQFGYENGETSINPYVMVALGQCGPGEIFRRESVSCC